MYVHFMTNKNTTVVEKCINYFRNDLYMTLERGEFERGGKTTGKNIEVTVLVLDNEGKLLEVSTFVFV